MTTAKQKPYEERTDLEKIQSQWTKLTGLLRRSDWSAAVVRAATATEIAANFAIRQEHIAQDNFDKVFVDDLLIKANGLNGKIKKLLPLLPDDKRAAVKNLHHILAENIYQKRNSIVHSGYFCSKDEATNLINDCQNFVHGIVRLYDTEFTLTERSTR